MTQSQWEQIWLVCKANVMAINQMDIDKHLGNGTYRECIRYWQGIMLGAWQSLQEEAAIRCGKE